MMKLLASFNGSGTAVALSPGGNRVAIRTKDAIRVFDVDAEKLVADDDFKTELARSRGFAFGPDNKKLIAQPFRGLLSFDALAEERPKGGPYIQTEGFVTSPDAKLLAAILPNPDRVAVLDATTGREVASFKTKAPAALGWSRDGKWVATADGPVLHVWSASTGKARLKRIGHDADIRAVAFAPDGKSVITGGADNLVYVWELPPAP
jgi:WD40 repeat protein